MLENRLLKQWNEHWAHILFKNKDAFTSKWWLDHVPTRGKFVHINLKHEDIDDESASEMSYWCKKGPQPQK